MATRFLTGITLALVSPIMLETHPVTLGQNPVSNEPLGLPVSARFGSSAPHGLERGSRCHSSLAVCDRPIPRSQAARPAVVSGLESC